MPSPDVSKSLTRSAQAGGKVSKTVLTQVGRALNRWLRDSFIAAYNGPFPIGAEQEGSAFVADTTGAWREILCTQDDRTVGNDNTVKWEGLSLQLPPSRLRPHFVKVTVRVHEYPDGQLAMFWGPHRLADYDARGTIVLPEQQAA